MRKSFSKNGLFGPRDRISEMKNKGYYQLVIIGALILGLILLGLFVFFVVIPMFTKDVEGEEEPVVIRENQNIGTEVTARTDLYSYVNEHLFKIRYVNQPQMTDKELICTGGMDGAGNPSLIRTYVYDIKDDATIQMTDLEIKAKNANIFYPHITDAYIVYVDAKADGGGSILMYDRASGKTKEIKEFYGAIPEIHLAQNRIIWFEQVTGDIGSIYVYDILLNKLAAVETQYGLPFVFGGIGVDDNKIIWPGLIDGDQNVDDLIASNKSQLYVLDLSTGQTEKYNPDMYAYNPDINGNIIGWLDTNNSPTASLYITVDGGVKKKLASEVTGYYIGDGVVTYCAGERMYCYFVEQDLTLPLSKEDKRTMMIGGENGIVFWYDITQSYERDIVKYAKVDASAWRN